MRKYLCELFKPMQSVYSPSKKAVEKPTTILAYMIATELLRQNYEISYNTPKAYDPYWSRGNSHRTFKITSAKFNLNGIVDQSFGTEYKSTWGWLTDYSKLNGVNFDETEKRIIMSALRTSLIQAVDIKKMNDEKASQDAAIVVLEKWIGLV